MLRAVMFDFGHTIMNEVREREIPLRSRPVCLMPGMPDILPRIALKMGIWANTKVAREKDIRIWLRRAGITHYFTWVVTSVDAGDRKPHRRFFSYALRKCKLQKDEVLFVGNQLNSDIRGANTYGIRSVWLSGRAYRSPDETLTLRQARPTYVIRSLEELPSLLEELRARMRCFSEQAERETSLHART